MLGWVFPHAVESSIHNCSMASISNDAAILLDFQGMVGPSANDLPLMTLNLEHCGTTQDRCAASV